MFKFEDNKCYQMPAHFGGYDYDPSGLYYRDMVGVSFVCTTDGDRLADYLPEGFELRSTGWRDPLITWSRSPHRSVSRVDVTGSKETLP